jgi:ribosome-binding factor A
MSGPSHHRERLAEEIRQEIAVMLAGELKDPRLAVSLLVSEVRLGRDHARVYVVVDGTSDEQKAVLEGLEAASGYIRFELAERLQLRRSPRLEFTIDRSQEYGRHIDELLRRVKEQSGS